MGKVDFDVPMAMGKIKTLEIGNEKMRRPGKELDVNWEGNPTRFWLHEHPFVKRSE